MTMTRDTIGPTARELLGLLVWFAQVRIKSTAQVERRFMRVTRRTTETFQEIDPEKVDSYRTHDQPQAKDWLLRVIAFDKMSEAQRNSFQRKIAKVVEEKVRAYPSPVVSKQGFKLTWDVTLDGVEETIAYTIALLLNDPKLRRRVGLCAFEECEKFFFDDRKRGGKDKGYCSTRHSDRDRKQRQRRRGG